MTFNLSPKQQYAFSLNFLKHQYEKQVLKDKETKETLRLRDEIVARIKLDKTRQFTTLLPDWEMQFTAFIFVIWFETYQQAEEDIQTIYFLYCLEKRGYMMCVF